MLASEGWTAGGLAHCPGGSLRLRGTAARDSCAKWLRGRDALRNEEAGVREPGLEPRGLATHSQRGFQPAGPGEPSRGSRPLLSSGWKRLGRAPCRVGPRGGQGAGHVP